MGVVRGRGQPEESAPCTPHPSLGPTHHGRQSHEVLLGTGSLRVSKSMNPQAQGEEGKEEGVTRYGGKG